MSNDSPKALSTPIVDGGLQRIPFFNGRVLTAEDLQTEQKANATERKRLGRALGTGVIEGLFVDRVGDGSDDPPTTVTVEPGLALAPSGRVLELPSEVELSVVSEIDREATAGTKGQFAGCSAREVVMTSGTGAYVLFAEPASETEGRTPRTRLGGDGSAGECGAERRVEGASLHLVDLNPQDPDLLPDSIRDGIHKQQDEYDKALDDPDEDPTPHASKLRNLWAHVLLKGSTSSGNAAGPAAVGSEDRRIRTYLRDRSGEDTVPLGLIYWASDQIEFVDVWAARTVVRPPTDTERGATLSDRRLERYLQFVDHLGKIVASHSNPREIRLDNYVRFVPPAGMVEAFQIDAPTGVDPDRFLERYSRGTTGSKRPGPIIDLLHRSLSYPPVDLNARPNLMRFRAGSAPDTDPSDLFDRRTLVYAHRDVGASSTNDGATLAFETARSVYRSILEARAFEPAELDGSVSITALTTIRGVLRDLLDAAGRSAAFTAGGSDVNETIRAFEQFYDAQVRVVEKFTDSIEGISDDDPRQRFAADIESRLRGTDNTNGKTTLRDALDDRDLVAAIDAQAAVNEYVGQWIGDTIATGPTDLRHVGSPDGDNLVPPGMEGAPSSFRYEFDLENATDQTLTFNLSATAQADTGDWRGSTTIFDADDQTVTDVTLESGVTETITVEVTPPDGASTDEEATLTVRAEVPAPNDRSMKETLELPIESSTGTPTTHKIEVTNLRVRNQDTDEEYTPDSSAPQSRTPLYKIPVDVPLGIRVDVTFTANEAPTEADVDVIGTVSIPSGAEGSVEDWRMALYRSNSYLTQAEDGKVSKTETFLDGKTVQYRLSISAPSTASRKATVNFRFEAPTLDASGDTGALHLEATSSG